MISHNCNIASAPFSRKKGNRLTHNILRCHLAFAGLSVSSEQEGCPGGSNLALHRRWQLHTHLRGFPRCCVERIRLSWGPQSLLTTESWQLLKGKPGPQLDLFGWPYTHSRIRFSSHSEQWGDASEFTLKLGCAFVQFPRSIGNFSCQVLREQLLLCHAKMVAFLSCLVAGLSKLNPGNKLEVYQGSW